MKSLWVGLVPWDQKVSNSVRVVSGPRHRAQAITEIEQLLHAVNLIPAHSSSNLLWKKWGLSETRMNESQQIQIKSMQ